VQRTPGLPCALFFWWRERNCKPRTKPCRENENSYSVVIARLDRATQYSRAVAMNTNALEYWITRFRG
jgi:hypothetical protein